MNPKSAKIFLSSLLTITMSQVCFAYMPNGTSPPRVELKGDAGGKVTGGNWSSDEIKDKVLVMFYVDPDESSLNDDVSAALKAEKFPQEKFGSIAVINMAATWKPNFAIESVLKKKQEEFPRTIYVKDKGKLLVKEWKFADDSSNILAFDRQGKVIYSKDGKLNNEDIAALIKAIKAVL
jgi:predicted transcriptional regulator